MKKMYCVICRKYRKFENPKTSYLSEKTLSVKMKMKKYLKQNIQLKY